MDKTTLKNYFSFFEKMLFISSFLLIIIAFFIFDGKNYTTLLASLIGVSSLIFNAKGNLIGQALMIVFSIFYGTISYAAKYYGEMITYLGMTMPMAIFALISWIKNPYGGKHAQVKINKISKKEWLYSIVLTAFITTIFYFVLKVFHTSNLPLSTLSVATSFIAAYLTFRRSSYFALAYALNDVVLIVLWILDCLINVDSISVVICFSAFLVNDLYGFFNWKRLEKTQQID